MPTASPGPQQLLGESDIQTSVQLQASELSELHERLPSSRGGTTRSAPVPTEAPVLPQEQPNDYSRYRYTAGVRKWWNRNVSVTVPIQRQRDYLALERTFLGYVRTSVAFSMVGIVIAQLFRLQHSINPSTSMGFFKVGVPLAATFEAMAILVAMLGACRFWRQQHAMLSGRIRASGWEVETIMVLSILVGCA